jgi:hypothetical protein
MDDKKPNLALVMIVKNEAASIREIIESVRGQIDTYVIVDTGSTDGTEAIARKALDGIPGEIISEPFVDFAITRNRSLELAASKAVFGLLLSGDETLVDPDQQVKRFCAETRNRRGDGAWNIAIVTQGTRFASTRLVRLDAGWHYVGEVHEVLVHGQRPPPRQWIEGCHIVHSGTADPDRKRLRLYRDLEILREKVRKNPADTRSQFYQAQTISDLGMHAQALQAYERRVKMGVGFLEEQYEAAFRMARTALILGNPWPDIQQLYLEAHTIDPRRAEPIYQIANFWKQQKAWPVCWMLASYGAEIPYPKDCVMFVDQDVYRYQLAELASISGFYVGQFERSRRYAEQALAARPDDQRLKENLAKYESLIETTPRRR